MDAENTLLSLIGHMLRQNLINIIELSNLILVENDSAMTDSVRTDVAQMKVEAADALSGIDNVLHLASHRSVPDDSTTISLSSLIQDIVPSCAQRALSGDSSFCIDSDATVAGSFQGNALALEDAITKAIVVLHALRPDCVIYFSAYRTETAVVLSFQTSAAQDRWVTASISNVFKKVRDVNTLIEMLICLRLVRMWGGQVSMLQNQTDEIVTAFQIQLA